MSRSNMVCRAKSLRLFAGITPASFCHHSISALAPSSFETFYYFLKRFITTECTEKTITLCVLCVLCG
ncbi:MAG: hypothetical protein HF976_03040 [ANME-2 cluster archaeon]|nr:hypothetical protein [ANME-2 cluster archaeon]